MLSTRASLSPSSVAFACGPASVRLDAGSERLREKVAETLRLFDHRWAQQTQRIEIAIDEGVTDDTPGARGSFLRCARLLVDAARDGLYATTTNGVRAASVRGTGCERWTITVPPAAMSMRGLEDVEEVALLALTSGWRAAGWVPLHVGAVARDGRCALLCASSGGGKSTLTAAFVRSGWSALGDDEVLLSMRDSRVVALQRTFNLDPQTRRWFPEVGDLERLPRYSSWTAKREVRAETIWRNAAGESARPTHVVVLTRDPGSRSLAVHQLPPEAAVATLMRQTVTPTDRAAAGPIVAALASAARGMRALDVRVGEDAYAAPDCLEPLEAMLR